MVTSRAESGRFIPFLDDLHPTQQNSLSSVGSGRPYITRTLPAFRQPSEVELFVQIRTVLIRFAPEDRPRESGEKIGSSRITPVRYGVSECRIRTSSSNVLGILISVEILTRSSGRRRAVPTPKGTRSTPPAPK